MPCFFPQPYRRKVGGGVTFNPAHAWQDLGAIKIPCNGCIGCRMDKAADWKTRLVHEASLHEAKIFGTATFADEHLPSDYSVQVRTAQLFIKRVRKARGTCRFFMVGEYGDQFQRPHYHFLFFGQDFAHDRQPWTKSKSGELLYRSPQLERLWGFGEVTISPLTPETAGYCARYALKKVNGSRAEDHYTRVHPLTGEVVRVNPEFITMSTRPGIGYDWLERFKMDVFPSDFVTIEGRKCAVPKYYTRKLAQSQGDGLLTDADKLKLGRIQNAQSRAEDNTPERLAVREEVLQLRALQLKRELT